MLYHYIKTAYRSLLKFKGFTTINIVGLALGLASGFLILIYVLDEISYDTFHTKADRIYRVNTTFGEGGGMDTNGWPIGNILRTEFPEVEAVLYTRHASFLMIDYNEKKIREQIQFASPEFFEIFSFPLISGNPKTSLIEPFSMVISEEMQQKYFGNTSALGQTLTLNDTMVFEITGVMKNIPDNSHIKTDMIASFATYQKLEPSFSFSEGWGNINMRNYILLKDGVDAEAFKAKAKNIYMERASEMLKNWGVTAFVYFDPMSDIYLKSKTGNGLGPKGSIERIYLLSGITLFIILLACINFINLATACSTYRAKEVGLRKVVGSTKISIILQFLGESTLVTILSVVVALALVGSFLPIFNELLAKSYHISHLFQFRTLLGSSLIILSVIFLSGFYPALVMSGLKPVTTLKGKLQSSSKGVSLRRVLVVFQFFISVSLLAGTFIIVQQLEYMQKKDLGFNKDEVIVINAARATSKNPNGHETFKNILQEQSLVKSASFCNALPGTPGWRGQIAYPDGKQGEHTVDTEYIAMDENYLNTLNLTLIAGHDFNNTNSVELTEGLIINEKAVIDFGWETPENAIGKKITSPSGTPEGTVIGVVKNYHELGLQQPIGPIALDVNPRASYLYAIRYVAADTKPLISQLEKLWHKNFPGYDFSYFFLDEKFEQQYQTENRLAKFFTIFSGITIVIAFIGLFGLVSFMVVTRTKEIGIRKILGASVTNITTLLSKEFLILVIIANLLSIPLAWYFSSVWLQNFAYRIQLSPMVFVSTLAIAFTITIIAVGLQSVKAATTNPVDSLRNE